MANTNTRVLRDSQPGAPEGVTDLPESTEAQELALLEAVRNGAKVIRKSTGKPVTVEELEAELSAGKSDQSAGGKKPRKRKKKNPSSIDDMNEEQVRAAYRDLEAKLGSQGQEVGQLRALTDKLLELKRTDDLEAHGGAPADDPISGDTLLTDPRGTIANEVERNPRLEEIEKKLDALGQNAVEQEFARAHPTYKQDMDDPEFLNWCKASTYRSGLAAKALQHNDFAAAHELWTAWDEAKELLGDNSAAGEGEGDGTYSHGDTEVDASADERAQQLANAVMVAGSGAGGDTSGKPIYSRQALINKRIQDPSGYYDEAFQAIIKEAYLEGRVK